MEKTQVAKSVFGPQQKEREKEEIAMAKGIYERKGKYGDVTYYVRYWFQGNEIKEKVGRKSRGFTKEKAKEALHSRLGDIARRRFNLKEAERPHPFTKLVDEYHKHAAGHKASYSREKYSIEKLKEYFKDRNVGDITSWMIEKWKTEQKATRLPATVNRELTILKHMLKMAVKCKLAPSDPSLEVARFAAQEGRIRYVTGDELQTLLLVCQNQVSSPWLHPLVVLALNTAARQGELLQLRFEDIDLRQRLIYFGKTKNRRLKIVPMNHAAREAIEWLMGHAYGDYLFYVAVGANYRTDDDLGRVQKSLQGGWSSQFSLPTTSGIVPPAI